MDVELKALIQHFILQPELPDYVSSKPSRHNRRYFIIDVQLQWGVEVVNGGGLSGDVTDE